MKAILLVLLAGGMIAGCKTHQKFTTASGMAVTIQEIYAKASPCFGACPVYEMTIHSNKTVAYSAIRFNKNQEGQYKTVISQKEYDKLISLLNATDFPQLKDEYKLDITDMPGMDLAITYNEGKVKKIHDYGAQGTPQLKTLYQFITSLRETQQWEKTGQ